MMGETLGRRAHAATTASGPGRGVERAVPSRARRVLGPLAGRALALSACGFVDRGAGSVLDAEGLANEALAPSRRHEPEAHHRFDSYAVTA